MQIFLPHSCSSLPERINVLAVCIFLYSEMNVNGRISLEIQNNRVYAHQTDTIKPRRRLFKTFQILFFLLLFIFMHQLDYVSFSSYNFQEVIFSLGILTVDFSVYSLRKKFHFFFSSNILQLRMGPILQFGSDRLSRFAVYWIQSDRQATTHKDSINLKKHIFLIIGYFKQCAGPVSQDTQ